MFLRREPKNKKKGRIFTVNKNYDLCAIEYFRNFKNR